MLTSFFRITSLQVFKVKLFNLTASLCFHIFVYPCCLKAWYTSKFNSKVVFIILILSPTTVYQGQRQNEFNYMSQNNVDVLLINNLDCRRYLRFSFFEFWQHTSVALRQKSANHIWSETIILNDQVWGILTWIYHAFF